MEIVGGVSLPDRIQETIQEMRDWVSPVDHQTVLRWVTQLEGVYPVHEPWDTVVSEIEAALALLSPEELETFAVGEENDMMAVIGEKYDLVSAHLFLNEFFEEKFGI
ncbi:MAG: hypothetical protein ACHQX3_00095 [Nitrospirales bacterium]